MFAENRFVHITVIFVTIVALYTVPIPGDSLLISAIQNAGHWALFFALTLGSCLLFMRSGRSWRALITVVPTVLMILGVAGEILQIPLQRDADWTDIAGNAQGIVSGMFTFALGVLVHRARFIAAGFCLLVVLVFATINLCEPVRQGIASFTSPELPVIADFDNLGAELRVRALRGAQIGLVQIDTEFPSSSPKALKIVLSGRLLSGVELLEVPRDWSAYKRLNAQIVNSEAEEITLGIRISDLPDDIRAVDGYHKVLTLNPGFNLVSVDLASVSQLPARILDLHEIQRLSFYAPTEHPSAQSVQLDDVILE